MERSENLNELAAALAKAQAEINHAKKDKTNPAFGKDRTYADLSAVWDACRAALTKHGLSVVQFAEPAPDGMLMLTTMLLHSSGQHVAGTALLPLAKLDPQGYGSAMTYARRYGLAAMVGVAPEDDDGNAASQPPESRGDQRAAAAVQRQEKRSYAQEAGAAPREANPRGRYHILLQEHGCDGLPDPVRHLFNGLILGKNKPYPTKDFTPQQWSVFLKRLESHVQECPGSALCDARIAAQDAAGTEQPEAVNGYVTGSL